VAKSIQMFHKGSKQKPRGIGFGGFAVGSKPKEPTLHPSPVVSTFSQRTVKHNAPGHSTNIAFKRP
jgi:hypothetical protein